MRSHAARLLGLNRDESFVSAPLIALKSSLAGKDYQVAFESASALGEIGDRAAVPALIDALYHDSEMFRDLAANAFAKIGDPSALPALVYADKLYHQPNRCELCLAIDRLKKH